MFVSLVLIDIFVESWSFFKNIKNNSCSLNKVLEFVKISLVTMRDKIVILSLSKRSLKDGGKINAITKHGRWTQP